MDRRRFLKTTGFGATGAAALALVGCGDDNGGGNSSLQSLATATQAAGATATPIDPFAGAKKGGTYRITQPTGDLVETAESTPDGLQWTMKMRKGVKFHNLAPVNGRDVTTDDVKFSWGRATDKKYTPSSQLTSVVDSAEFPDASTIVFKLKAPSASFLDLMADAALFHIMPTEADGKFNPATTMIGSGPWVLDNYTPTVGWKFKKNPSWWNTGFPLMDAVELAIVPEYATRLAQFQAGNSDAEGPTADDLIAMKQSGKDVITNGTLLTSESWVYFDSDPASPWNKDERVRQAVSMAMDRDGLSDVYYSVKKLNAAGLNIPLLYNNVVPAGHTRFWLDPKSADQGETSKFFKYDVAEAKKLMSAAGFPDGFSAPYQYTKVYGAAFDAVSEANISLLNAIGIKTTTDIQDYASKYSTHTFAGDFKGIAYGPESSFPDAGAIPLRLFTDNPLNHSRVNDPELTRLSLAQASELDEKKRKAIMWDIQRANAKKMYYVPHQGGAGTAWSVSQPYMRNITNFRGLGYGAGAETSPYFWKNQ